MFIFQMEKKLKVLELLEVKIKNRYAGINFPFQRYTNVF